MATFDGLRTPRLPVAGAYRAARVSHIATITPHRAAGTALLAYVLLSPVLARTTVVVCPFRRLTGCVCPICGLTRSLAALLAGDLRRSITLHPLGWAVVPAALDLWIRQGHTSPVIPTRERSF